MNLMKYFELLNTDELFSFFKRQKFQVLHLDDDDFSILRNNKISGTSFLYSEKDDFRATGLTVFISVELNKFRKKIESIIEKSKFNPDDSEAKQFTSLIINERTCDANSLLEGEIKSLVDKILSYHKQKSLRAFRDYKESAFQTTVELLLPQELFISEMRLIVAYKSHSYKHGFTDIFLCDNNYGHSAVLELKLFNLIGLYSGEIRRWEDNPEYNELKKLDEILQIEPEEKLLKRRYMYWCKKESKFKLTIVKYLIDDGISQLHRYLETIKKGRAQTNRKKVGICESSISIYEGISYSIGYLLASFGSQRIYTINTNPKKLDYKFFINKI